MSNKRQRGYMDQEKLSPFKDSWSSFPRVIDINYSEHPNVGRGTWIKPDNQTPIILINNVLTAIDALSEYFENTDPTALRSGHVDLTKKLMHNFRSNLRKQNSVELTLNNVPRNFPHYNVNSLLEEHTTTTLSTSDSKDEIVSTSLENGKLVTTSRHGDDLSASTLQDFKLSHVLGVGTFGVVWLLEHNTSRRNYCLKVVNQAKVVMLHQIEHIFNEKDIMSTIDHPFIIKLFRTFRDQSNLYFLMEYVPGGEFFNHLRKAQSLPNEVAKFYAAEVVLALEYLHKRNILYRDLKPENLILDERGHIKLADFGYAKITKERTFSVCGTSEYMCPETYLSTGHNVGADWWALGILIYEMLCGYPPFEAERNISLQEKIIKEKLDFPTEIEEPAKKLDRTIIM